MISQILEENLKYFPCSLEEKEFTIVADEITGNLGNDYLVGQYVNIHGSVLNDGTYQITGVTANKLTVSDTLLPETNLMSLYGLAIPRGLLVIVAEIETYTAAQTTGANIASESQGGQGGREVKYMNGSTWRAAFADKLEPYRAIYDDRLTYCRRYNITTKGWY